jgi:hypothetical protein
MGYFRTSTFPTMILLLSGASETARSLVVDKILDQHKDWKHLALEDLRENEVWEDEEDVTLEDVFGTMIACDCAKDVQKEGCHIVITSPSSYLISTVQDAFDNAAVTVHMGKAEDPEDFTHVLDPKKTSLNETHAFLEELIAQ